MKSVNSFTGRQIKRLQLWLQCQWQSPLSLFHLHSVHSYTSVSGWGSPCMGGSTGSIQPGVEKTGIFIENAASLFLLPKTEQNYTPCARRCWDWIELRWLGKCKTAAQRPGAGSFLSANVRIFSLDFFVQLVLLHLKGNVSINYYLFRPNYCTISTSEFNLRRFKSYIDLLCYFGKQAAFILMGVQPNRDPHLKIWPSKDTCGQKLNRVTWDHFGSDTF